MVLDPSTNTSECPAMKFLERNGAQARDKATSLTGRANLPHCPEDVERKREKTVYGKTQAASKCGQCAVGDPPWEKDLLHKMSRTLSLPLQCHLSLEVTGHVGQKL